MASAARSLPRLAASRALPPACSLKLLNSSFIFFTPVVSVLPGLAFTLATAFVGVAFGAAGFFAAAGFVAAVFFTAGFFSTAMFNPPFRTISADMVS